MATDVVVDFGKFSLHCWDLLCDGYDPCEADPDDEPKLHKYYRKVRNHGRKNGLAFCVTIYTKDKKWIKQTAPILRQQLCEIIKGVNNCWIDNGDEYGFLIGEQSDDETYYVSHGVFYKDEKFADYFTNLLENKDWQVKFKLVMV